MGRKKFETFGVRIFVRMGERKKSALKKKRQVPYKVRSSITIQIQHGDERQNGDELINLYSDIKRLLLAVNIVILFRLKENNIHTKKKLKTTH
jgi:hypothetical protein